MLERLITGHAEAVCVAVSFAIAASIFLGTLWRALRMDVRQRRRFSRLPFDTPTPPAS